MITKIFEKFNYITVTISVLLLLGISIYYSTLEIKWSFFESQILNTLVIFSSFLLTSYSIDTVTRQITIERSGRNALHLILYPLVILSYPLESVDLRFIISSALIFSAWRIFRIFIQTSRYDRRIKQLLDTSLLLSLSVLLILENIVLFIFLAAVSSLTNIKKEIRYFVLIITMPLIFIPAAYIFLETFSLGSFTFSSFLIGDDFSLLSKPVFSIAQAPFAVLFFYYLIAVIAKTSRSSGLNTNVLDMAGVLFLLVTAIIISLLEDSSGSEYHYFSLVLVYFIAQFFSKKINSSIVNFIFISIIASIIIFNLLL